MNFNDWIRGKDGLVDYLTDVWDVVVLFGAPKMDKHGLVGHTKTRAMLITAEAVTYELNRLGDRTGYPGTFEFSMERDLVIRDDYPHFDELLRRRGFGQIKAVDEGEWFAHDQYQGWRETKDLSPLFDSNRKEQGVHLYAFPNVGDAIPKLRDERGQYYMICQNTGSSARWTIYQRDGMFNEKKGHIGRPVVEIRDPPKVPNSVWYEYEALYQEHMDLPCPEEDICMAAIRKQRRGG